MQPDEIVTVPGPPHTFGLPDARSLLRKLEWELGELGLADTHTHYRAFNVAVTAWHLIDWVWQELPPSRRAVWRDDRRSFRDACEQECPDLALCGMIAEASKHRIRDRPVRKGVATFAFADVVHAKCGEARADDPLSTWTWRLVIRDGEHERSAADVFSRVLAYWQSVITPEFPAT